MRNALAALAGAGAMIGVGQLFALMGGSCTLLCRPPVAAIYGAVLGLLVVGPRRRG
jgi:hypothetical protein